MSKEVKRISCGVSGLDEILGGGLISGSSYLVRGGPGTGKTTLALQFLLEGIAEGEKSLFITLTETEEKLRQDAYQREFNLEGLVISDLSPSCESGDLTYNIFPSSEVEQSPLITKITQAMREHQPDRLVIDGITQFLYVSPDAYQFRKQILCLIQYALDFGCTMILTSEASQRLSDDDLQFMSDGVINLDFQGESRNVYVTKLRGSDFICGTHSIKLTKAGMVVYPKLNPKNREVQSSRDVLSTGVPELDELLNGGIERGTATVISGPTGVGKTTLGTQFMKEAAARGQSSVIYTFEEARESLLERCESVSIPLRAMIDHGTMSVEKINPLEYTPDEFAYMVRNKVERMEAEIVMLDSISGYLVSFSENPMAGHQMLRHLHALTEYLKNMGVTLLLINEIQNITGDFKISEYGISYVADNIIFLRYLEVKGELRKAIGVLKKRKSNFEKTLREIDITRYGLRVGRPLDDLRGILTGDTDFIRE